METSGNAVKKAHARRRGARPILIGLIGDSGTPPGCGRPSSKPEVFARSTSGYFLATLTGCEPGSLPKQCQWPGSHEPGAGTERPRHSGAGNNFLGTSRPHPYALVLYDRNEIPVSERFPE
jgi:hypothetical protein